MAIVDAAVAVGGMVGLEGTAAAIGGGALLGGGIGGLYSGITGDGNVLNSMLNGALIGGAGMGIGAEAGLTGASGSLFGTPATGILSGIGSSLFPAASGAVAPTTGLSAGVNLGTMGTSNLSSEIAALPGNAVADASVASPSAALQNMVNTQAAEDMAAGPAAAGQLAPLTPSIAGPGTSMLDSIPSWAKWGAGLMAANSIISNSNKKYGTLSPSQTTSLPLQYQSNFGTYKPLDTSVMRPMGAPAGYNGTPYGAPGYIGSQVGYAEGGIAQAMPSGGPVEQMSRDNALGQNQMFPQSQLETPAFSSATNTPMGSNMIAAAGDVNVDPYTGAEKFAAGGGVQTVYDLTTHRFAPPQNSDPVSNVMNQLAISEGGGGGGMGAASGVGAGAGPDAGFGGVGAASASSDGSDGGDGGGDGGGEAAGGLLRRRYAMGGGIADHSSLGSYAAGGNPRLLKGPGDGMSDNIPAQIGASQPARLADGEFVIPADVVSHLGNGSTDAGAKKLHAMMDNVRRARTGRKSQGKQIKADKFLPK